MGQLRASEKERYRAPEAEENIIVINTCGFIDNAKAESVRFWNNADKKERGLVDKVLLPGCLSERYRPDLEKRY
jgi:ribosomal protein S12 methylthiotransferase